MTIDLISPYILLSFFLGFLAGFIVGWISRSQIVKAWYPEAPWAKIDYTKWFKAIISMGIILVFLYVSIFNPESIGNAFTIVITIAVSSFFGVDIYDLIDKWRNND